MSLSTAALLAVTGFVNSWFLLGSPENLFANVYGRWLLAKIVLFCVAVALGAVNLLRLKPRLMAEDTQLQRLGRTTAKLQTNVQVEFLLGTVIVVIVAILGILPPAGD